MRLAAAIEATDPDGRLLRSADILDVRTQNSLKPVFVLTLTDEVAELVAEHIPFAGRRRILDFSDPVVRKLLLGWIFQEDILIECHVLLLRGHDWDGQIIPTIASVEEPIGASFFLSREKHEESSRDAVGYPLQHISNSGKWKQ